jgi:hypothetical protein
MHRKTATLLVLISQLKDKLALQVDPNTAVNTVFSLELALIELSGDGTSPLTPHDYISALNSTERWYTSRGYKYPYPERLAEQRAYWTAKI